MLEFLSRISRTESILRDNFIIYSFFDNIKSDIESGTTEPADDLCDLFVLTIVSRSSGKILFGLSDYAIVG